MKNRLYINDKNYSRFCFKILKIAKRELLYIFTNFTVCPITRAK